MSLIVAMHLGNFAVIAADRRVVSQYGNSLVVDHDNAEKIVYAGMGFVSGSGIIELLDSVIEAFLNTKITHTDQILQIITEERKKFLSRHFANQEWAKQQIQKTGWMFTYPTVIDDHATVRIAMLHGSWDSDDLGLLCKGMAKVFAPVDGTGEEAQRLSDILTKHLKTTDELPDLSESISYHIPFLQTLFNLASESYDSVSKSFHIAVHTNDGRMLISSKISTSSGNVTFEAKP